MNSMEAPGNLPPFFLTYGQWPFSDWPPCTTPLAPCFLPVHWADVFSPAESPSHSGGSLRQGQNVSRPAASSLRLTPRSLASAVRVDTAQHGNESLGSTTSVSRRTDSCLPAGTRLLLRAARTTYQALWVDGSLAEAYFIRPEMREMGYHRTPLLGEGAGDTRGETQHNFIKVKVIHKHSIFPTLWTLFMYDEEDYSPKTGFHSSSWKNYFSWSITFS